MLETQSVTPACSAVTDIRLFQFCNEAECQELARAAKRRFVKADEILFRTGEPGGTLYIVQSGVVEMSVKDTTGRKVVLNTVESGEFLGEVSLLDGQACPATATALEDSELIALCREDLLLIFRRQPEMALRMLTALGNRLRETDKLLQNHVAHNVNEMMEENISPLQRAADFVAWFSGSLSFLLLNALWFAVWIALNTLPLGLVAFDPYPFGLLTMIVSLEAIFLSCFVLISQNRQSEKDRLRADVEYDVNIKAEMEVAYLHEKTDRIYEQMLERFTQLERLVKK